MTAELAEHEAKRRNRALDLLPVVEKLCLDGDEKFPSVIETLWSMLNDDTMLESPKGDRPLVDSSVKVKIATKLLDLSALGKEVEAAKGLSKIVKKAETHNHLTIVFDKALADATTPEARETLEAVRLEMAKALGAPRD